MTESFTFRVDDEETRRDLRRALSRLELNHDELWDAESSEIGESIVRLAVDNPDLLLQKLAQVQDANNSGILEESESNLPTGDEQ